jgi:hypothetical protein
VDEVIALEEQGRVELLGECIGKAIAEVKDRGGSAALAKAPVRVTGNFRLPDTYRLDSDLERRHELVESILSGRLAPFFAYDSGFEKVDGGYDAALERRKSIEQMLAIRFALEDRNQSRRINYDDRRRIHFGNPFSS